VQTEESDKSNLFLVKGSLLCLQKSYSKENLLDQIQKQARLKNVAAGMAAVASDMYGMIGSSASLLLYDGEDVTNFAAMLGKQVVCGTFRDAKQLDEGDKITAVVHEHEGILYAKAVIRDEDQMLLLPQMVYAGERSMFRGCMRFAFWMSCIMTLFIGGLFLYFWSVDERNLGLDALAAFMGMSIIFPPVLMYPFELWTYRTIRGYGYVASEIFRVLGVPLPEYFDSRTGLANLKDNSLGFTFAKALAVHKEKFKIKA